MEGRLLGGCLDCLVNLVGTGYDKVAAFVEKYKEDGIIWFLESCDLNVFSIARYVAFRACRMVSVYEGISHRTSHAF